MAVHNENGSNIENAEFGPSFKGGLSALDDDDDNEHYGQRSNFENEFNASQQSPVKRQSSTTDAHIYAVPPQHGVRNNLTAAFTTLEGN